MTYLLGGRLLKQVACLKGCSAKKLSLLKNYPFSVWKGYLSHLQAKGLTWPEPVLRPDNERKTCRKRFEERRMLLISAAECTLASCRCSDIGGGGGAAGKGSEQTSGACVETKIPSLMNFLWNNVLISVQRVINFNYIMFLFPNFHYKQFKCVPKLSKLKQSSNVVMSTIVVFTRHLNTITRQYNTNIN